MIAANSRYASTTIVTLDVGTGSRQVIYAKDYGGFSFNYVAHTYSANETIDGIANAYYGDPTQWWKIGLANPEVMDWSMLVPGTTLRIPVA